LVSGARRLHRGEAGERGRAQGAAVRIGVGDDLRGHR